MNAISRCACRILLFLATLFCGIHGLGIADETRDRTIEQRRLETMREHAQQMDFRSKDPQFPRALGDQVLFRYDDPARGYVDGAVWRLGVSGRPRAIITTELHPRYFGRSCIVCDYLSTSDEPFVARVAPNVNWTPGGSAVKIMPLDDAPKLAGTKPQRLLQLKRMAERFAAHQNVEGEDLELRLLPSPIDRYQPTNRDGDDAAIFVFVSGRMPGILLLIEATENGWQYGAGPLSAQSTLTLKLNEAVVWQVEPINNHLSWQAPYTAANFPSKIPGIDAK